MNRDHYRCLNDHVNSNMAIVSPFSFLPIVEIVSTWDSCDLTVLSTAANSFRPSVQVKFVRPFAFFKKSAFMEVMTSATLGLWPETASNP